MTRFDDRINARIKAKINKVAQSITYRSNSFLAGKDPQVNPPTVLTAPVVSGATSSGATSINIGSTKARGYLRAGDSFTIAGDATVYTITNSVTASSDSFTGVTFTPALAQNAANGAAVTFTYAGDTTVQARVQSYPQRLIDGELIRNSDLRIQIASLDLTVEPKLNDAVIFGGKHKNVVNMDPAYVQEDVGFWIIQVR